MNKERRRRINRVKRLFREAADAARELADADIPSALGAGAVDEFLRAVVPRGKAREFASLQEYLLAYKHRLAFLAMIRHAITRNHAYSGTVEGKGTGYISPFHEQWIDDGVIFLQSRHERFAGLFGLYRKDGSLSYAVAARSIAAGEKFGPESIAFISLDEFRDRARTIAPQSQDDLRRPLCELERLIEMDVRAEREYQELLQTSPWLLGLEYSSIDRHTVLDDRNIPDFTGVRAKDGKRDIIEIKTPALALFRHDGEFHSEFHQTWDQAERYLNFAREERDYLARKRLAFDSPRCTIIAGRTGAGKEMDKLAAKLRLHPVISFFTYDDLLSYARHTVQFIERLRTPSELTQGEPPQNEKLAEPPVGECQ